MYRSGKDASKHNPQIGSRAELGAHDGTEDGACARNVKKLNHENLPSGKNDVIDAISLFYSRGQTVVGSKNTLYELAIDQIA